jgi:hypothetical protein
VDRPIDKHTLANKREKAEQWLVRSAGHGWYSSCWIWASSSVYLSTYIPRSSRCYIAGGI